MNNFNEEQLRIIREMLHKIESHLESILLELNRSNKISEKVIIIPIKIFILIGGAIASIITIANHQDEILRCINKFL